MWTLNKRAKLSLKVQQDLTQRSEQGLWAHPFCLILVTITTGLLHRAPVLMGLAMAAVVVQATLRWAVLRCLNEAGGSPRPRHLERLHVGLLLSCAALWGLVPGFAIYYFGSHDRDVLMLLLYHAAVAFATVNLLVHDRALIRGSLGLLFGPVIVGHLCSGEAHLLNYLSAVVIYMLYCVVQGKKLNDLYGQQISDNYELSIAAYRDCLTGLPNRLYMNQVLESCMETVAKGRQVALLYIDLDGFKQINDRHSHKVGDMFLCEAAARITSCLRSGDVAARIGGDEFTILLPECASEKEAMGVANRVLHGAREPIIIDGHPLSYSTSIGVSVFPNMASSAELLVRSADEAMYAAKMSGKDRVCLAPSEGELMLFEGEYEVPMLSFCSMGGMTAATHTQYAC